MRNRSKIDDAACARQDRRKAKRWGFRWQPNKKLCKMNPKSNQTRFQIVPKSIPNQPKSTKIDQKSFRGRSERSRTIWGRPQTRQVGQLGHQIDHFWRQVGHLGRQVGHLGSQVGLLGRNIGRLGDAFSHKRVRDRLSINF